VTENRKIDADFERSSACDSALGATLMKKIAKRPKRIQEDKNYIEVMGKIFTVLEYFVEHSNKQKSLMFSEIAASLPFARTTVHRILYSLEKLGYIEKDDQKSSYRLAGKFFDLTGGAVHFRRLLAVARSEMQTLLLQFGETVNLGVLEDGQITYIDVLQSSSALRIAANPGARNPVHCTSLGKAILAYLPESEALAALDQFPMIRMTSRTITQKKHYMEHLAQVREKAIALDMEEHLSGVVCVAAPIFDRNGKVIASISISGPTPRMKPKLSQMQDEVKIAASNISRMLSPSGRPGENATPRPALERGAGPAH
jgi:IclR family KDG regulon transcriptional repressor